MKLRFHFFSWYCIIITRIEGVLMIGFSICCFIFVSIFTIFYFSKERINTIDTKLYSSILICNLFGLVLDIFGYLCFKNFGVDFVISECVSKIYLVYYFTWAFLFLEYIYVISFRKNVGKLLKNNRLFRFNIFIIFKFITCKTYVI